jgi:hypothetical protein
MNTLFDVKKTLRSMVGDDAAEWTTDGYLLPKINFAYRTQTLYIKRSTGANLEQLVEIPNALDPAGNPTNQGLTSLAQYQQPGGLLYGLYEPLYMWWKPAGTAEWHYRECFEKKTLAFTRPLSAIAAAGMQFTWRSNQLFVTPVNMPIDIMVDGRFNPPPLTKDEQVLVVDPDMEVCLTAGTLGLVGIEAGNTGYTQAAVEMVENAADDIVAKLIRQKQGPTARAGSASERRRGNGAGWNWY